MPDDNFVQDLEDGVEKDAEDRKRSDILNRLATVNPTLEDLFNVCQNSRLGDVMKTFTLDDLASTRNMSGDEEADEADEADETDEEETPAPRKKRGKKKAAKKVAKRGKKKVAKKAPKKAPKAKTGKTRKARQNYDELAKEVHAYMKKAKEPVSTGTIVTEFNISGSQARKVCEVLVAEKKAKRQGAGRGTKYELK